MATQIKRWLFLIHRWLGIVVCAFFAMWFLSGVVMMYVGYPKLTESERLAHLPPLDARAPMIGPRQALDAAGIDGPVKTLQLAASSGGRPVYLIVPDNPGQGSGKTAGRPAVRRGGTVVVDAQTGTRLTGVDKAQVLASAAAYLGSGAAAEPDPRDPSDESAGAIARPTQALRYEGTVTEDAFTHSRALDPHRPLHLVLLPDPEGTLLYISSLTGEIVGDATRTERVWNYVGAWIHWLYPFRGNWFDRYWTDIVNWISIVGIAVALTGTVVGILRWRFSAPYRRGSRSPYASGMMKWHHISGLLFALVSITWIFSGLMSMNPWKIFDSGAPPITTQVLRGGPLMFTGDEANPQALLAAANGNVREISWSRTLGTTVAQARLAGAESQIFDARTGEPHVIDDGALRLAAATLLPLPLERIEQLDHYDLYYYARAPHTMMGGGDKPLPVWRLVYGDSHASWIHLDPRTGAVLGRTDSHRRTSRWLFAMLHSWDWLPLLERRPLWDVLLIVGSAGGFALSLTGVVVGWRRLKIKYGKRRYRPAQLKTTAGKAGLERWHRSEPRAGE